MKPRSLLASCIPFLVVCLTKAANIGYVEVVGNYLTGFDTTDATPVVKISQNITVQNGASVILHCSVESLIDNATVSWLRRGGDRLDLVSVGQELYSGDTRYQSKQETTDHGSDWTLTISSVNKSDEGHWECHLNSHPPVTRSMYLHVIVPDTIIFDDRGLPITNKFYDSGSTIALKCTIRKVPPTQPNQFIIWTHNSTILNYDTTRGGISVKTDITGDGANSQLFVNNVGPSDSGNYSCSLGELARTSVSVAVITETLAAMQQGAAVRWSWRLTSLLAWIACLITLTNR